jgi:hypothetical protein
VRHRRYVLSFVNKNYIDRIGAIDAYELDNLIGNQKEKTLVLSLILTKSISYIKEERGQYRHMHKIFDIQLRGFTRSILLKKKRKKKKRKKNFAR